MLPQPPDANAALAQPDPPKDAYEPTGKMLAFHHFLTITGKHYHLWLKDALLVGAIIGATVFLLIKAMTTGADQALLMILSGLVGSITTMLTGHALQQPMMGGMGMGGYSSYGSPYGGGYGAGYSSSPYGQSYGGTAGYSGYPSTGAYPMAPTGATTATDPYSATPTTATPASGTTTTPTTN